ncbi:MAG: uL15 family ribosomal protein [Candidatus Shapirobacteria bacterium]|nr:uL15 family ribosomal protein [Candidatus Shapirobacteria bacterium]
MEILSTLSKTTVRQNRRVGRGYGSKKGGHTTGRGQKGDKSRGTPKITFDGTKIKKGWIKRTPFLRGKHRVLPSTYAFPLNLGLIDTWFKEGDIVDLKAILKKLKSSKVTQVKVLAGGKLTKSLTFKGLKLSEKAKNAVMTINGKIE